MTNLPSKIPGNPLDALKVFEEIKKSVDLYVKVVQEERSKRADVQAKRDVAVAQVEGQTEILVTYLKLAHDSRADYFDKQFKALDKAMGLGDSAVVSQILDGITEVARTSPFADLRDADGVRALWADKDNELEI